MRRHSSVVVFVAGRFLRAHSDGKRNLVPSPYLFFVCFFFLTNRNSVGLFCMGMKDENDFLERKSDGHGKEGVGDKKKKEGRGYKINEK